MATYVWTLSGGDITQEKEHFLLWILPLKRGNQYYHAARIANGEKTVATEDSRVAKYRGYVKMLKEKNKP